MVRSAVRLAQCDEKTKSHDIRLDVDDVPHFEFDVGRVKQVLLNLIRNASDAISGTGTIAIETECRLEDGCVLVSVRDTGCGISEAAMLEIWEPFMTTKGQEGTGLGLDFCKVIVEAHGGSIDCNSELGGGSTFYFTLPLRSN